MSPKQFQLRLVLLFGLTLATIVIMLFFEPIPQPQWYHNFADQRCLCGIPHALNVVSNFPFVLVGVWGMAYLLRHPHSPGFRNPAERWPYVFFFLFIALTGIGSAYYHADPTNDRLLWDRLPLAVAIMTLFALVIAEHINRQAGMWLFFPLILLGAGSVVYWHQTEVAGHGDMRLYLLVQFYPMLALPFILFLFPSTYTRSSDLGGMLAWYVVAKILELLDQQFYSYGQIISGHTLKHLAAGFGGYLVLHMLKHRRPVTPAATT